MKPTEKEVFLTFAGLTNALIDTIELDVIKSSFCKQQIKFKSKNLMEELKKVEDKLFPMNEDFGEASTQYIDAGSLMLKLYRVGLKMTELTEVQQQGLSTQLNILMKNYGIEEHFD